MKKEFKKILDHPIDRRTFLKAVGAGTVATLFSGQATMEEVFAASPKVGILQLGTCAGCQVSLTEFGLDMRYISSSSPTVADILPTIDIKYAPLLVDVLAESFEHMDSLDICIIEGIAGPTVESSELLDHARSISTKVVALGDCASYGGVPGLNSRKGLLDLHPINEVISVDAYIRGCPPQPEQIWYMVTGGAIGEAIKPGRVCDPCIYDPKGPQASELGQPGCKKHLGCQGHDSPWQCGATRSTGGKAPCTLVDDICIGCYRDQYPLTPYYVKGQVQMRNQYGAGNETPSGNTTNATTNTTANKTRMIGKR